MTTTPKPVGGSNNKGGLGTLALLCIVALCALPIFFGLAVIDHQIFGYP